MATLTGATSILSLSVENLFPTPTFIQGFAVDDAFRTESVSQAEVLMGVDGKMSYGFVFNPYKLTIVLQADSPSVAFFDAIRSGQAAAKDVFRIDGAIGIRGIATIYTLTNGVLTSAHPVPDVKKILQPLQYEVTFESITPSPL